MSETIRFYKVVAFIAASLVLVVVYDRGYNRGWDDARIKLLDIIDSEFDKLIILSKKAVTASEELQVSFEEWKKDKD